MKFTFEGHQYRITFRHKLPTLKRVKVNGVAYQQGWGYYNENSIPLYGKKLWIEKLVPGCTLCEIFKYDLNDWYSMGVHYAYQNKKDIWSRDMGRKVSLGKALHEMSQEFQQAAWRAYEGRTKKIS